MRKNDLSHQRLIPRRPTCDVARNSPVGLSANEVGGEENFTERDINTQNESLEKKTSVAQINIDSNFTHANQHTFQ